MDTSSVFPMGRSVVHKRWLWSRRDVISVSLSYQEGVVGRVNYLQRNIYMGSGSGRQGSVKER